MKAKVVFQDGTWFIGRWVNFWEQLVIPETQGTHHWMVRNCGNNSELHVGDRVVVPINSMKYCVFAKEFYKDGTTVGKGLLF
jgi:hypothetical protein